MAKKFASVNDTEDKKISFTKISEACYGYTAEGDPNSGVVIGEKGVMVIEAQATPLIAKDVIKKIRSVTDLPITHLVLTHYHAVRVLGAAEYKAKKIICSTKTLELIEERGEQDWLSEFQRFPRLFRGHESIEGLTMPTHIFDKKMTIDLGNRKVELISVGEGHTKGDSIVWVPDSKTMFSGDLVENGATPYCGDANLTQWPKTLKKLSKMKPEALVTGRGDAIVGKKKAQAAISMTREFVEQLLSEAQLCVKKKYSLKECYDRTMKKMKSQYGDWVIFEHCMPFNVKRAYDEANGIKHPKIWTQEIDLQMWNLLNSKN